MITQETSRQAHESIKPVKRVIRNVVKQYIDARGPDGATCDEIERAIAGAKHQTISSAITSMKKAELIHDGGQRRPTRSGRDAIVWVSGAAHEPNGQKKLL